MTEKIDRPLRWGILSTARIGANAVIPAIHASTNGIVAAVGSRDLEKGRAFAAANGIPKVHGSYEALLADPEIDAIYNPLPNHLHGEWSIKALEAGKHVLCEKPLAANADEAQQMVDVSQRTGKILAEAFMYRFHPQTMKVKEMLEQGAVGTIQAMNVVFCFSLLGDDDIRVLPGMAGGALMDVGCYCVNVIRHMIGEEPTDVRAFADWHPAGIDDRLAGLLRFPSGALAHFDCSVRTHMTQTYEIRGTHGRIYVERGYVPFRPDPEAPIIIKWWSSTPGIETADYHEITVERTDQYRLMVEDFARAVAGEQLPRFPIADSVSQMRVLDQLLAAARA